MENPYTSPEHQAELVPEAPRFRPLAIVIGSLADITFTLVTNGVLGVIVGVLLIRQGVRVDRLEAELNNMMWVHGAGVLLGCCGTFLGGYVAASISKSFPLRHAFAVAVLSVLIGLVQIVLLPEMQPLWVGVASLTLAVPAALLGGYLRATRVRKSVL